eukprot:1339392-Amorphochlora_amoeboformis.AAC.1
MRETVRGRRIREREEKREIFREEESASVLERDKSEQTERESGQRERGDRERAERERERRERESGHE